MSYHLPQSTGTSITVIGNIDPNATDFIESSYTLDSRPATRYTAIDSPDESHSCIFFQATNLSLGWHLLTVKATSCGPDSMYWLDYLTYETPALAGNTSTSPIPSISPSKSLHIFSSIKSSNSSVPTTRSPDATTTLSNIPQSSSHPGTRSEVLVPAILASIFGATLLLLGFLLWRTRRRRKRDQYRVGVEAYLVPDAFSTPYHLFSSSFC